MILNTAEKYSSLRAIKMESPTKWFFFVFLFLFLFLFFFFLGGGGSITSIYKCVYLFSNTTKFQRGPGQHGYDLINNRFEWYVSNNTK